ncbi:helix-turn-helix domain protein [Fusobacterium sp. CAG:439]|nr:helix-turn-helix domain protein [Fusobacterium sp. CAG:439]
MKKNEDLKKMGEAIRLERLKRHLSQEKFAEMADMPTFQHLGRIEKGQVDIQVSTLLKILRALKIKFEDLIEL